MDWGLREVEQGVLQLLGALVTVVLCWPVLVVQVAAALATLHALDIMHGAFMYGPAGDVLHSDHRFAAPFGHRLLQSIPSDLQALGWLMLRQLLGSRLLARLTGRGGVSASALHALAVEVS